MDAELEVEVVEVIEVMPVTEPLPQKLIPRLLLDLVHGSVDHLQDGLRQILQILVEPNEKRICCWNLEPRTWNLDPAEGKVEDGPQ